jgi:hypothetical protein
MLFKVLILLSAAGVKTRERKHPSAAREAERAAALLRKLMKVPDRAFERALGMSSAAPAEYTAGLQPTARGQPQLAFNFILGPNSPGSPSGSQKKSGYRWDALRIRQRRSIRGHRLQFLAARHPSGSRLLPQVRKSWPEIRPAPWPRPRVLRMITSFIMNELCARKG